MVGTLQKTGVYFTRAVVGTLKITGLFFPHNCKEAVVGTQHFLGL